MHRASHGVDEDVQHLLQFIKSLGKTQEDGSVTVTFVELFADDVLQNTLEVCFDCQWVGVVITAATPKWGFLPGQHWVGEPG